MKKIRTIKAAVLEEKKLKVCAYVRVSTDQVEQKNSFSAQMEHYTAYIKNNPVWNFAGIYADSALSGKNVAKRPEFMRMINDAENKKFDLIITKSISRFARNTADCLKIVRKLKSIGVGIQFEKEAINTLDAESELMLSILSSVAEEELVSISQNMRDIIKNEKYIGDMLLQKTIAKDFKKKRNKGEVPMYYVKDTHPAIIGREDFEKAQELMVERGKSMGNIEGNREKYLRRYSLTSTIVCGHCGKTYKRHIDNCGNVAESSCWVCSAYILEGKNLCNVGRVKEETIKGLFVRVFNRLNTDRIKLLGDYKVKLEREKFTEIDQERIEKLDEEIESLIQQERALFFIEGNGYTDHNLLKAEHEKLVGRLTHLQTERTIWMAEMAKQDSRIARTMELEAILDSQGGRLMEFREDLYTAIIEKIVVKERTSLEFHLKNGFRFEENYTLK